MAAVEDYSQRVAEVREKVLGYVDESWPVVKTSHGVEVSCHQPPDIPVKLFKTVGEIDAPPSLTFEYAAPGATRGKWDQALKNMDFVEELDERTFILHTVTHSAAMGLISPRDFIDLVRYHRNEDGKYYTCATGSDYPYPEDPSLVRGRNYPSGTLCFPVENDPNRTKLICIIHCDIRGYLPYRLIDSTLPSTQVTFFNHLRKAIKNRVHEQPHE